MLPLFFGAHVVVVAVLLSVLKVQGPLYHAMPWIFGGAFLLTLVPPLRRQLEAGSVPVRALPVLLYAGVISLASSVNPRAGVTVSSNMFHPVEYAGLAFLGLYAWHQGFRRPPTWRSALAVALACTAFGVLDETHQSFVPGRDAGAVDVGLDALGAALGTGVYLFTRWGWTKLRASS